VVHADEVFIDGVFNGDPHPGNILLMDDGRLGLIDYGQVKELDLDTRISLAQLYIALEQDDREAIVRLAKSPACGLETKYMNPEFIYKYVCFYHDRDTKDITMGLNVQQFSEYLDANDPIVRINDDVVMVSRSSILLRGMANAFQFKLATSTYWAPVAKDWLNSIGAPLKPV
jgi:aarF domain-containing kinase